MYYDLLARIKNAQMAEKESLTVPFSTMDYAVAKILVQAGYLKNADKKSISRKSCIEIKLAYKDKKPLMNDFKIISKPSRRIYIDYRSLRPVKQGYGIGIISTPRGVLSEKEAKKRKVGGEYLVQVW